MIEIYCTCTNIYIYTVEPVCSDKKFRSQNISLTFFVKKPEYSDTCHFRHLTLFYSPDVINNT